MSKNDNIILLTNDDGIEAKGLKTLAEAARKYGRVVIVAPDGPRSAQSHAITVRHPLTFSRVPYIDGVEAYKCSGTPADCVKIGIHRILDKKPALVLSGINHGPNTSTSIFYSGTMGAAIEGFMNETPAIGLSLDDFSSDADFSGAHQAVCELLDRWEQGTHFPVLFCFNVNIPAVPFDQIKGWRISRQLRGSWREEFVERSHPYGAKYYWLTGTFVDFEPYEEDTDIWALKNEYISLVPIKLDLTDYEMLKQLKQIDL